MSARREISAISWQEIRRVNKAFRRYTNYIVSVGQYFQYLL